MAHHGKKTAELQSGAMRFLEIVIDFSIHWRFLRPVEARYVAHRSLECHAASRLQEVLLLVFKT